MIWITLSLLLFGLALYKSHPADYIRQPLLTLSLCCIALMAFAWNLKATLPGQGGQALIGFSFHFFGASLLVAMLGIWRAMTLLFCVAFLSGFLIGGDAFEASRNYILIGVLPALVSASIIYFIKKYMPKHLFVLILGTGYVAGFASVLVSACLIFAVQQLLLPSPVVLLDPLGWFLGVIILSFMEGSLSGMLLAIFLVYRPNWVATYNESAYVGSSI